MDRDKALKFLEGYQKIIKPNVDHDLAFNLAICYTQLDDFIKAQQQYERSCIAMFQNPILWKLSGQTDWLVNVCLLSSRTDLFINVWQELEQYRSDYRGDSAMANSSYGLMELLKPKGWDIDKSIKILLKRPKYKDMYAFGKVLKAIIENETLALHIALEELLRVHAGQAKYGILRESAEGLLCMSAMALMYTARKRGIHIEIENEYLSNGYVEYILIDR